MKGVTLIGRLPPPSGGIATHLCDVRALLERRGVRVTVLEPRRWVRFAAGFLAHALMDVVHVHHHGHSRRSWWQAAAFALAPRAVMTIHSSLAPELIVQRQALVRRASAHYRAIVCTSDVIRDAMIAAGIGPERLWVAPAFIADALEERMTPAGLQAVRRRHAIVFATWVDSTYEPGLPVLLEAFAKLRSTHPEAALIVAGQAVWRPEYARPNVYLLGRLARAESLGLVATCDVFVWPPLLGGDDIRIREALALGRRVVATDAARRPPGVQLCRAGDAADLARVMAEATFAAAPRAPALQARETLLAVYRQLGLDDGEDACATSLEA